MRQLGAPGVKTGTEAPATTAGACAAAAPAAELCQATDCVIHILSNPKQLLAIYCRQARPKTPSAGKRPKGAKVC